MQLNKAEQIYTKSLTIYRNFDLPNSVYETLNNATFTISNLGTCPK